MHNFMFNNKKCRCFDKCKDGILFLCHQGDGKHGKHKPCIVIRSNSYYPIFTDIDFKNADFGDSYSAIKGAKKG